VLESIRRNLGREAGAQFAARPPIVPPRQAVSIEAELDLLISEINKLAGNAKRISCDAIGSTWVNWSTLKKSKGFIMKPPGWRNYT
jgi:hypothetical protein